jgi:hypothetical protein
MEGRLTLANAPSIIVALIIAAAVCRSGIWPKPLLVQGQVDATDDLSRIRLKPIAEYLEGVESGAIRTLDDFDKHNTASSIARPN